MKIAEKNRIFLAKLQNLPENKKKIILWTIVIVAALAMGFFWFGEAKNNLAKISGAVQNVKMPEINMPSLPFPDLQDTKDQSNQTLEPSK
jgi:hypothetical protein